MIKKMTISRGILMLSTAALGANAFAPIRTSANRVRIASPKVSILDTAPFEADDPWYELEQIASIHQEEKGRVMFHEKELELLNSDLALQLKDRVNYKVPTTWEEATTIFWNQPQAQVLGGAFLASALLRFLAFPTFGFADLAAIGLTKAAWELQEWAYHYRNFHGNNGKSHFPFDYHNQHHDLPYYHVAMEPTSVCACYVLSVTGLATITGAVLGPLALPVVATTHASFLLSSLYYIWVHYLAHSKVPLKGELQAARMHHIQHHLDHEVNLNMASHTIDSIVGTVPKANTRQSS